MTARLFPLRVKRVSKRSGCMQQTGQSFFTPVMLNRSPPRVQGRGSKVGRDSVVESQSLGRVLSTIMIPLRQLKRSSTPGSESKTRVGGRRGRSCPNPKTLRLQRHPAAAPRIYSALAVRTCRAMASRDSTAANGATTSKSTR
eukprot:1492362-Rhodomonas_salina.1